MTPMLTAIYAGVFAIAYIGLSYRITVIRRRDRISLGAPETHDGLLRAVRVHGNFAEYVPFALVLIALAELNRASAWEIHALGAGLVIARVLHAWGLGKVAGRSPQRFWGTALTFTVVVGGGIACIVHGAMVMTAV